MPTSILDNGDWNYSGNPATSLLDEVRFWCGDSNTNVPLMSDAGFQYLIDRYYDQTDSPIYVAAVAADVISAKLATEISISADGVSVSTSELQDRYAKVAESLRSQYKEIGGMEEPVGDIGPILTGIWSVSAAQAVPPLMFGTGMNDNYEAGRQDYGDYSPGENSVFFGDDYGAVGESSP